MAASDTIRLLFTYGIALVIVIGGGYAFLFIPDLNENTKVIVAGFMGSAITFVFGQEVQTRTARQAAASTAAAAGTVTNGEHAAGG